MEGALKGYAPAWAAESVTYRYLPHRAIPLDAYYRGMYSLI